MKKLLMILGFLICHTTVMAQEETLPTALEEPTFDEPASSNAPAAPAAPAPGSLKAPPPTKSQPPAEKKVGAKRSGNVLDFEGEVIEGERRRPDLFLQMSIDNVKFDSLIYQRDDFNDYLEVDRKSRTRYLKLK